MASNNQPNIVASSNSGASVAVGCKLPNGIHLDFNEAGKPVRRVTLKGANSSRVVGGYGITENVSKEFFDEWMLKNKEHPAVRNGLIFAQAKVDSVEDKATEQAEKRHLMEPLDPEKPGKDLEKLKA